MTSPFPRAPATAFLALVRHARALRAGPGEPDGERALSEEGRAEFERQLTRLSAVGFECDVLWTSPLRRARQTAAILAEQARVEPQPREGLGSDPDSTVGRALVVEAAELARSSRVVLVGHQPWLAEIARWLGAREVHDLECGEVVWLVPRRRGGWRVAARLHPS